MRLIRQRRKGRGKMLNGKKIAYVAGPMRGVPQLNFPAFDAASAWLAEQGYAVFNPAQMDRERGFDVKDLPEDTDWNCIPENFDLKECISEDLKAVQNCDVLVLLPGYEKSMGCAAELAVARWAGKKIADLVCGRSGPSHLHYHGPLSIGDPEVDEEFGSACLSYLKEELGSMCLDYKGGGMRTEQIFPEDDKQRLEYPIFSGLLDYFPHACAEVARHSKIGNDQHNPGEPMHWAKEKSIGRGDKIVRHLMDGWTTAKQNRRDKTIRHLAAMCWRALELLERYIMNMEPFKDKDLKHYTICTNDPTACGAEIADEEKKEQETHYITLCLCGHVFTTVCPDNMPHPNNVLCPSCGAAHDISV